MAIQFVNDSGFIDGKTCLEQGQPWLRPQAARYIEKALPEHASVFEWGMGGSTIWFAQMGSYLTSCELDYIWKIKVYKLLESKKLLDRVSLRYFTHKNIKDYTDLILRYPDDLFDLILVDGRNRCNCFANAKNKVTPGGLLVLDNSERPRYASALELVKDWEGMSWGDKDWITTVWIRPIKEAI